MPNLSKPATRLTALAGTFALVGCASVADVKPGTSYDDVVKQFGEPSVVCAQPDGSARAVWTQEPSGEYAWAMVVGKDKQVSSPIQVLTVDNFNALNQGEWNNHTVKCQFGLPAKVQVFADHPGEAVWVYRFLGPAMDYDMAYVRFDRVSNKVVGSTIGPDPRMNPMVTGGR